LRSFFLGLIFGGDLGELFVLLDVENGILEALVLQQMGRCRAEVAGGAVDPVRKEEGVPADVDKDEVAVGVGDQGVQIGAGHGISARGDVQSRNRFVTIISFIPCPVGGKAQGFEVGFFGLFILMKAK